MSHYKGMVKPYIIWSFLLIALPLVLIVLYSITSGDNSLLTIHLTLDNFRKILDPVYVSVFVKSLEMGVITTVICLHWHTQWHILLQNLMKIHRVF